MRCIIYTFPDKLTFLSIPCCPKMCGVCIMDCDTGKVFYAPLKFPFISMLNVTVTSLSRLQFFLGNWNAFVLYSLQGFSLHFFFFKHFHQWDLLTPTEGIKIYCSALYWCQQNCVFSPWCDVRTRQFIFHCANSLQ